MHTHTCIHRHLCMYEQHRGFHARIHACTHAHAQTHTHTHTHTQRHVQQHVRVHVHVHGQVGVEQHAGLVASPAQLVVLYSALTLNNAVHAWAFFHMLERVGAVTSAVMKGVQLVLVFGFSFLFFCQLQTTQCFSWTKAAGVATVTAGLLVYACSTPHSTASRALEKRRMVR